MEAFDFPFAVAVVVLCFRGSKKESSSSDDDEEEGSRKDRVGFFFVDIAGIYFLRECYSEFGLDSLGFIPLSSLGGWMEVDVVFVLQQSFHGFLRILIRSVDSTRVAFPPIRSVLRRNGTGGCSRYFFASNE